MTDTSTPTTSKGMKRRTLLLAATLPFAQFARAAAYPDKPIKIVLPFASGGTADVVARLLATKLQERLGQPVIVEARAGANGIIGADFVARAPADGYTLLLNSSAQALNESLYKKLPYDPRAAFAPVAQAVPPVPFVLAVHSSVPASSMKELVAWGKANPGALTYGSAGVGSTLHLGTEMLAHAAGIKVLHVPYKGAAPALTDLAGGQIKMMINSYGVLLPFVKEGKIKLIAQTGASRSPLIPDLPTVSETGLAGFDFTSWYGLYAPAATPRDVIALLNSATQWAMSQADVAPKLALLGATTPDRLSPEAFAQFHRQSAERFAVLVKGAGLVMDAGI
ncbi:MAG: tripartite tricarboxylate transporter substrate binding protein [Pseudomonadota bacterium]